MIAWVLLSRWREHRENPVRSIGGAAVFKDGRPCGRRGGAAEGAGGAGPRSGSGVATLPRDEDHCSGDAEPDDSDGRDAAALSGDSRWHATEWRALLLCG